ncbi:uncharacterized protein FTOL_04204 [Fusarium torulosum]|uniref:Uncharacterized protein n=1 Tax=Fusarium torulosum TaxID=33205 RepID=A0AAE8SFW8_9HYPO|nr:uncharacterized protein FTOL_04204 [Fusarium torulosum]
MKNGNAQQTFAAQPSSNSEDKQDAELEDKDLPQRELIKRLGGNLLKSILEVMEKLLQAIVIVVAKIVSAVKGIGNVKLPERFITRFYR